MRIDIDEDCRILVLGSVLGRFLSFYDSYALMDPSGGHSNIRGVAEPRYSLENVNEQAISWCQELKRKRRS